MRTVPVSFRPHNESYDYEKFKDSGIARYRMLFPIGMQFLKLGETYDIGIYQVQPQEYMIGDLDAVIAEEERAEWKQPRES